MRSLLYISTVLTVCLCFATGQTPCTTPNGKKGRCIALDDCSSLKIFTSHPTPIGREFLSKSLCMSHWTGNSPAVCCEQDTTTVDTATKTDEPSCEASASLPSADCCGVDGGGPKIFGGNETAVDEQPWLALLEYKVNNVIKLLCGGVVITGQHVLTAAHCFRTRRPINVRLGEHNTTNSGSDCVQVPGGTEDCNDGAISIPIENIIIHTDYNPRLFKNDIALIKLARIVEFTAFIRPICLPTEEFTTTSRNGVELYAAGWGRTETADTSDVKLKVLLPYVSIKDCQISYSLRNVQLWEGQICAGGEQGKDSCTGDSGGPLVRNSENRSELVGIVSFGPSYCGLQNYPGVYTKVFYYLSWITSQIRNN